MGTSEAAITKQELIGSWKGRTDTPPATFEQLMENSRHQLLVPSSSCNFSGVEEEIQPRYRATRNARGFYLSLLSSYLKLSGVRTSELLLDHADNSHAAKSG